MEGAFVRALLRRHRHRTSQPIRQLGQTDRRPNGLQGNQRLAPGHRACMLQIEKHWRSCRESSPKGQRQPGPFDADCALLIGAHVSHGALRQQGDRPALQRGGSLGHWVFESLAMFHSVCSVCRDFQLGLCAVVRGCSRLCATQNLFTCFVVAFACFSLLLFLPLKLRLVTIFFGTMTSSAKWPLSVRPVNHSRCVLPFAL